MSIDHYLAALCAALAAAFLTKALFHVPSGGDLGISVAAAAGGIVGGLPALRRAIRRRHR